MVGLPRLRICRTGASAAARKRGADAVKRCPPPPACESWASIHRPNVRNGAMLERRCPN